MTSVNNAENKLARGIVARLIRRMRFCKMLLGAPAAAEYRSDAAQSAFYASYVEAHNAAEIARRMLYNNVD